MESTAATDGSAPDNQMRVVVTGGAGFIGANLCRHLLDAGVSEVVAFDDLSTGSELNLQGVDTELIVGSILDETALSKVVHGASSIVHLAARPSVPRSISDPSASHEVNATGTLRVLEAARNEMIHTIVASSSSVYGANPTIPKTEDLRCVPLSPYAVSKLATEAYASAYGVCFGLPTLAFRFFNVYGPLQAADHAYAAVVPAFLRAALRQHPLEIHGDGKQSRDFTYVGTVVDAIGRAVLAHKTSHDPVNLAFSTQTSLLDLVQIVEQELGYPLKVIHREARPGDVRHSRASDRRLQALLPELAPVDLAEGVRRTISWFQSVL